MLFWMNILIWIEEVEIKDAGSVLSALYQKENAVIVGNPAKIVKEQIFWKSSRKETFEVPDILKEKWNLR